MCLVLTLCSHVHNSPRSMWNSKGGYKSAHSTSGPGDTCRGVHSQCILRVVVPVWMSLCDYGEDDLGVRAGARSLKGAAAGETKVVRLVVLAMPVSDETPVP